MKRHTPCTSCPFRTDIAPYLHHARAREIALQLTDPKLPQRKSFMCHKTLDYDREDEEGQAASTPASRWCNGALIVMKREGILWNNEMARFAALFKLFDPEALDLSAPVPASLAEWVKRHEEKPQARRARRPKGHA